ncbi:hypothetical protein ES707_20070 [subsurface metagenome]
MKVQKSIEIAATPEKIWPFLVEPERILKWYIPLQKFEYTSEQHGGAGAPFYFEEKVAGQLMKLNCVVTEWVENKKIAFSMTSGKGMKSYGERWTVEATPSGSRFTFMEQAELPYRIIDKLIGPLAQRMSGAIVEKMLVKLKSLVET